jgi:hypothetical protein
VALGSASTICFRPSGFDSESKSTSDSEAFSSTTSDCLERHSSVLCQRLVWYSHRFLVSFDFSFPFLCCGLDWLSREWSSLLCPLLCGLGPPLPCFNCEEFTNPNSHLFSLNFCSILTAYLYIVPNDAMSKNSIYV